MTSDLGGVVFTVWASVGGLALAVLIVSVALPHRKPPAPASPQAPGTSPPAAGTPTPPGAGDRVPLRGADRPPGLQVIRAIVNCPHCRQAPTGDCTCPRHCGYRFCARLDVIDRRWLAGLRIGGPK